MANVLIACEYSGVVREAFRRRGHNAWSNDILDCDDWSEYHIKGDCFDAIERGVPGTGEKWDAMIAHPPCTFLTNSGVRWLYVQGTRDRVEQRWADMADGAAFFKRLLDADIEHIAVENPIMHGHAKALIGVEPSQIIQPWQFGHGETKATCLWLKNLPLLKPTNIVDGRVQRVATLPKTPDRWKLRSTTYAGIGDAMGDQWGSYLEGAWLEDKGPPATEWDHL